MSRHRLRPKTGHSTDRARVPARSDAGWRRRLLLARLRRPAKPAAGRPRHAHRDWAASACVIRGGRS
ncbi:MAG: hypothetical protein D6727_05295 [Gammaproteobacteria bacterium]|nr:MAG: hypothetical protein D6727_05295 [Gammaproteobacteria bacterium]